MQRREFLQLGGMGALAMLQVPTSGWSQGEVVCRLDRSRPLQKIAFGSCNRQDRNQAHWRYINNQNPDLWLWLGDNIYADWASPEQRVAAFNTVKNLDEYQRLRRCTEILGIWDDHDYGADNVGAEYVGKEQSQQIFCDFLDVPWNHPTRHRPGIYRSDIFGTAGEQTEVIALDTRYFKRRRRDGGLLGRQQWDWLEQTLASSSADLLIIMSAIHVTSKISGLGLEGWNSYPGERRRLYELLAECNRPVVLLSGDRHWAEVSSVKLPGGLPIHEVMSSGLTHALYVSLPNADRAAPVIGDNNYGILEIDWQEAGQPIVKVAIQHANSNNRLLEHRLDFRRE